MSLNSLFGIARSSLFAHQQALAVTSANLANANNPAYSRQVVMFGATPPNHRATFSFGTGVEVKDVLRIRNQVTDNQIRNNNQNFYDANQRSTSLRQVESLFSEPSEYGLSNLMSKFFNSWDELAVDPASTALRTNVTQSAQNISEKITSIHKGINQTRIDVKNEAKNVVDKINFLLEGIHNTNKQIHEASAVNNYANDLLDQRDAMLDELSKYTSINVRIDEFNVANVSIGGVFAVDGFHNIKFDLKQTADSITLVNADGSSTATLQGGELNGMIKMYNEELPNQIEKINQLANVFMENVNSIHEQGFTITNPIKNGVKFFSEFKNGVLSINEEILKNPHNIAVSGNGSDGNNDIALLMAELQNSKIFDGKTIGENYSELVSGIANSINLHQQNAESYSLVLNQLENQKMQYSGVSTDEEMINVMQFQRSYDAAAKLINVADDLLETLINLV